ncbi:hypothetical protein ACVWZW_005105 [Bradyrhizobium sp. F1.13.4]
MPSPWALDSSSVSVSSQSTSPLASGIAKPSATKLLVSASNSRKVTASLPPRDRLKMFRGLPGSELVELSSQSSRSLAASWSISSTISHAGSGLRNSAVVVRRHSPRGLVASFQRL